MPTASRERPVRRLRHTILAALAAMTWMLPERRKRKKPLLRQSRASKLPNAPDGNSGKEIACPHCGLRLTIKRAKRVTRISFAFTEWRRLCRFLHLDSPVHCLVATEGSQRPN